MTSTARRQGKSSIRCDSAMIARCSAAASAGGRPRKPPSSRPTRVRSTSSAASPGVERRQRHRGVAEDLDSDPAGPEQDHRPEDRVAPEAQDQLLRLRPPHHRLQHEAVDPRLRRRRPHPFRDRPRGRLRRRGRGDVEDDRAEVGLVADVARQELDCDPPAAREHRRRLHPHRFGRRRHRQRRRRDAVGGEDRIRLGRGQHSPPLGRDRGQERRDPRAPVLRRRLGRFRVAPVGDAQQRRLRRPQSVR